MKGTATRVKSSLNSIIGRLKELNKQTATAFIKKNRVAAFAVASSVFLNGCCEPTLTTDQIKAAIPDNAHLQKGIDILEKRGWDIGQIVKEGIENVVMTVTIVALCKKNNDTDESVDECIDDKENLIERIQSPSFSLASGAALAAEIATLKKVSDFATGKKDSLDVSFENQVTLCANEIINKTFKGSCDRLFNLVQNEILVDNGHEPILNKKYLIKVDV